MNGFMRSRMGSRRGSRCGRSGFRAGSSRTGFTSIAPMSSMSCVKMSEAAAVDFTASTNARFLAILRTVLYTSAMSGFSCRPPVRLSLR